MHLYRKALKQRVIESQEPIPVGVVEELDWAAWADTLVSQNTQPAHLENTDQFQLSRIERELAEALAGVAPRGL
jgi:hypothetical protein